MKTGWKVFLGITGTVIGGAAVYEGVNALKENGERHTWFNFARQYCDAVGKPLLSVGMRRHSWEPPNPDYVLDTDPAVLDIPNGVLGNECDMPFSDKQFGFVYNAHTLEHLDSIEDIERAITECRRVADFVILLCPNPNGIYSNLFCATHKFRLWFDQFSNRIIVKPSNWQTGMGTHYETGASMLTYEPLPFPAVIKG